MKHGKGSDFFSNGDTYSGMYVNGKPNGHGLYTWANRSYYDGEFKNGLKHGKGKWKKYLQPGSNQVPQRAEDLKMAKVTQNFLYYEGNYKFDKKDGYGVFTWSSGNLYKGDYKEDERHGHGEMRWTDGSCYIGAWVRGIQHGYGKIVFPDGTEKEGYFENNLYIGPMPRTDNPDVSSKMKTPKSSRHRKADSYRQIVNSAQQNAKKGGI